MFWKRFENNPLPDPYTLPLFPKWHLVEELYVPRPSHCPVFDGLKYVRTEGKGLGGVPCLKKEA